MAVFRVERNSGYTVMSNHHLRNKELTLKAKGLLPQMLSLPEDWDYESLLASAENLRQEYDRLLTWADLFDTCSFEAKKMIVAQFVKAVRVSRDYNIEIDFNVSFEEFQNFSVKNGEPVILQPLRSHTA